MANKKHAFIPDTQIKPGVPLKHIVAAAYYLEDKRPDVIVLAGDWWDMPSLSSYDKVGSKDWEGKDVKEDFEVGCDAMAAFLRIIRSDKRYNPKVVLTMGNHEDRVRRARQDPLNRRFRGFLSDDNFQLKQMRVKAVPFQEIITIDGIMYSHYFVNPDSAMARPFGFSTKVDTMVQKLGGSFTMGHQQVHKFGTTYTATGQRRRGLISGSFYMHDEEYLGAQKNRQHWRGIILKHEVNKGDYDLMEVSLEYLLENWYD